MVGYQVRRTIADVPFTWFEHLLHNPTHGFRWLVESSGHFTLAKTASGVPSTVAENEAELPGRPLPALPDGEGRDGARASASFPGW